MYEPIHKLINRLTTRDTAGLISILNQHAGFANANAQDAEKVHAVCDAVVKRAGTCRSPI
jgi:hypothetical protein